MSAFLYADRSTVLHQLHPVTKVIGLVLGFALALVFSHPIPALGAVLVACGALMLGGGARSLARAWRFLLLLFVMTTLIWSLFLKLGDRGGQADLLIQVPVPQIRLSEQTTLGGGEITVVEASWETLQYGAAMGLRIVACIVFGLAFLTCTRTEDFALALRSLGAPQGVSVAVSLAFRLVPTLAGTATNVMEAQQARGLKPESGNILRRIRNYVPLIAPVLAYALRGADLTAMALESRGLGAAPTKRTHYRKFHAGLTDALIVVAMGAAVVACVWLRSQGFGVVDFS